MTTSDATDLQCIGNVYFGTNKHASCPAATPANTYSAEVEFLDGPVPAGGGSVTNLEAVVNTAPTAGQSHVVEVMNNTTGTTLLSCTVTAGNSSCQNVGSAAVPAGHYLQVRIDNVGGASNRKWRVTFRY